MRGVRIAHTLVLYLRLAILYNIIEELVRTEGGQDAERAKDRVVDVSGGRFGRKSTQRKVTHHIEFNYVHKSGDSGSGMGLGKSAGFKGMGVSSSFLKGV